MVIYDEYQGLIFDMDGTLLDTEVSHFKAWHQVFTQYNLRYDKQAIQALNGTPSWNIAKFIIQANQADYDPYQLAIEKMALVEQFICQETILLPLVEVVKSYYGRRPMALGTGSLRRIAEPLLSHFKLIDYFDVIVCADDVEQHKPAPDTFLRCAEQLGIPPSKCLVFEDADFGIQAAKSAGMDVIDVRRL